jgi:hypothetical protein
MIRIIELFKCSPSTLDNFRILFMCLIDCYLKFIDVLGLWTVAEPTLKIWMGQIKKIIIIEGQN